MNFRLALSLAALVTMTACTGPSKEDRLKKASLRLELGTTLLMKGQYPQALKELLEANRLSPADPLIHNNLGLAYLVRERFAEAERHFTRAIELNSAYTDARNNLGRLYIDLGAYPKAIRELEIAAADLTYSAPEKSFSNLGMAYFLSGRFDDARISLKQSLKHQRGDCLTLDYYGRSLFELKNYNDSAESLDQAVKICEKSKSDVPHFYSAMSFYKLGKVEQARGRFEEILQQYPGSVYANKSKEMLEILP